MLLNVYDSLRLTRIQNKKKIEFYSYRIVPSKEFKIIGLSIRRNGRINVLTKSIWNKIMGKLMYMYGNVCVCALCCNIVSGKLFQLW